MIGDLDSEVGPTGVVIGFEPFRTVFQALTANVALNGLANVHTVQEDRDTFQSCNKLAPHVRRFSGKKYTTTEVR